MGRLSVVNQPNSLSDLVELAIRHRDTSGLGLSQLAAKNGMQLTATTINQIRQGLYKSKPREGTLRALAWLAGVTDEVAFTAAGQAVPGPPFAEELPPGVDNLPAKARKAAIEMLRVLVDMNRATDAEPTEEQHQRREADQEDLADWQRNRKERRNARAGQKTEANVRQLRAADHPDNNIPLPDDYEQLAAHPATESSGRREHEAGRERGEESQE